MRLFWRRIFDRIETRLREKTKTGSF